MNKGKRVKLKKFLLFPIVIILIPHCYIIAAGCSFLEAPWVHFYSIYRISLIWFGSGLIRCGFGCGAGTRKVVCVEQFSDREWIWFTGDGGMSHLQICNFNFIFYLFLRDSHVHTRWVLKRFTSLNELAFTFFINCYRFESKFLSTIIIFFSYYKDNTLNWTICFSSETN